MSGCIQKVVLGTLISSFIVLSEHSIAQLNTVPNTDSMLYYRIGGGRHISIPPTLTITTINLLAGANVNGLNCGRFDLGTSIEASLDDLRNGIDNAVNAIESAASAAIANLPGYILQKANPGLYDLFQNALLRAQESFSLATKSCERMEYEISNNINPYAEWITLSRGDSWKRSIGVGETNIHNAVEEAEDGHNEGVVWVGGIRRGGTDQAPIRVLGDVASAGINILSGRAPETGSDLPADSPLTQHFDGPNAVRDWVTDILGDLEITVCDGCERGSVPGRGLIPYIEEQTDAIQADLIALLTGSTSPTRDNLITVSAPGINVTHQVIQAIRNQSAVERDIIAAKLSHEIAQARVMEEAMIVRRFLITGKRDSDVSAMKIALKNVDHALLTLEKEVNNVIFENRTRGELVAGTLIEVLLQDNAKRQSSISMPPILPVDEKTLKGGTVEP